MTLASFTCSENEDSQKYAYRHYLPTAARLQPSANVPVGTLITKRHRVIEASKRWDADLHRILTS